MSTVMTSTARTVGSCQAARTPALRLAVTEVPARRLTLSVRGPSPSEPASPVA